MYTILMSQGNTIYFLKKMKYYIYYLILEFLATMKHLEINQMYIIN